MDAYRDMFRREAWRHYEKGTEEQTFPKLVLPRSLLAFWVLLAVVIGLIGLVFLLPVSLKVQGYGVVLPDQENAQSHRLAVLFDAGKAHHLKKELPLFVKRAPNAEMVGSMIKFEAEPLSPAEAADVYPSLHTLVSANHLIRAEKLVLVWVQVEDPCQEGEVFEVSASYGKARLASFLPLVGRFFEIKAKDGS